MGVPVEDLRRHTVFRRRYWTHKWTKRKKLVPKMLRVTLEPKIPTNCGKTDEKNYASWWTAHREN